jgi:arsenite methyltransferase
MLTRSASSASFFAHMRDRLAALLVDPEGRQELELQPLEVVDGDVLSGTLTGRSGHSYPIRNGIPRFTSSDDAGQTQTSNSFGFKWAKRDTFDSPEMMATFGDWLTYRYGFQDVDDMRRWFHGRELILDAGCGAAMSSSLFLTHDWNGGDWVGADISGAVDTARERLGAGERVHVVQADLMRLPFADHTFDTVFSEGVLHHTPSTRAALESVTRVLRQGGEILFYVYVRKAPGREFMDDHIRDRIAELPPEEAWDQLRSLTRLGQALADLGVEVEVPEDVPLLGISAGRYDVQRLVYYNFAKLFWNDLHTFEENVHVNFDWYHPRYAHRQSPEEVRMWCEELSLDVQRFDVDQSGITVRAIRRG